MKQDDLEKYVREYYSCREPYSRHASFDYCHNYFRTCEDLTVDMEKSCLTLGFYLASWGMFRGKRLLWKSVKHYESTIKFINLVPEELREIDVENYDSALEVIVDLFEEVSSRIRPEGNSQLIVGTKVLLGVFSFIPAYDDNFRRSFKKLFPYCGFGSVTEESLMCIKQFYDENKEVIDKLSEEMCTIDFSTGQKTNIHYKKAKIIDMYGWQKAFKNEETQNVMPHFYRTTPIDTGFFFKHDSKPKIETQPEPKVPKPRFTRVPTVRESKMTKKMVVEEMISTPNGATIEEIAQEIANRGIDSNIAVNRTTVNLWFYKIGFKVEKLPDGRRRKALK